MAAPKRHRCPDCGLWFRKKTGLRNHKRDFHDREREEFMRALEPHRPEKHRGQLREEATASGGVA